ncbi:MAG: thermopsin family protease [Candidatus Thermoplasmatota archaeon]|jgi:thermopsin|nr:thermopsin family protease [Candidatus Thermoplasmatota archaeon]
MKFHGRSLILAGVIVIVSITILSGLYVPLIHGNSNASQTSLHNGVLQPSATAAGSNISQPISTVKALASTVTGIANASGAMNRFLFLPNINANVGIANGHVSPLYSSAPAPMGIGDFGVVNGTGESYNTSSFKGTLMVNNLSDFYLLNDAPNTVSVQLNAVLGNATVKGNDSYSYWTQNVMVYSTRTHNLSLEDNVWNFSSPTSVMEPGTILHSTGNVISYPGVHIALGPSFTVTMPFTISLYLNSTNNGTANNTVFFNYSLTGNINGSQKTKSGTFDQVTFNSAGGQPAGYTAKPANFSVNGNELAPNGLLYDAEFMIGGPGGGSTTSIYNISASMSLKYISHSAYKSVPSAYDFGTDTGETSEGTSAYYSTGHTVHLNEGPSLLYGLWNTGNTSGISSVKSGFADYSGKLSPSNGFMFINAGNSFNASSAEWAPTDQNGSFEYILPPGNYSAEALMSNHDPFQMKLASSGQNDITLSLNYATGIYTPLFADGNSQLKNISYNGSGTAASPYVLFGSNESSSLNQLFTEMNDFTFPVFGGLMISNVSDHAIIDPPSFRVSYPVSDLLQLTTAGLPEVNYLSMLVYGSSNISIENSSYVSGWFSEALTGFPAANILLWNSTDINITGNYFASQGSSMIIYNPNSTHSNNTVTGNVFSIDATVTNALDQYFLNSNSPVGLELYSSNNTIYNNFFSGTAPAVSPGGKGNDIYSGGTFTYSNKWNISIIPGKNIIGGKGISGNYWMNYNENSSQPHNDGGLIAYGSDKSPLQYPQSVTFSPSTLNPGTEYLLEIQSNFLTPDKVPTILFGGVITSGKTTFSLPNGTYEYYGEANGLYTTVTGNFTVSGMDSTVSLKFISIETYEIAFTPIGLSAGSFWNITISGNGIVPTTAYSAPGVSLILFGATNGTYNYSVSAYGYTLVSSNETVVVSGRNVHIHLNFTPDEYSLSVSENGLGIGTQWSITINGTQYNSTNSTIIVPGLSPGTYSYTIGQVAGYVSSSGGRFTMGFNDSSIGITFIQAASPILLVGYAILGVIAGGVVSAFLVYRKMRKK